MSLLDFQRRLIQHLIHQTRDQAPSDDDTELYSAATNVHRRTILTGLLNAVRLTFPTVVKLTEESFFRQLASGYALINAPRDPVLFVYADSFPLYLSNHPDCAPYLWDVARLDLTVDRTAHLEDTGYSAAVGIGPKVDLALHTSLQCMRFNYATDLIRSAAESDAPCTDLQALLQVSERHLAVWRSGDGVTVKPLSPPVAAFLGALLRHADVTTALKESIGDEDMERTVRAIETELFASSCVQLRAH
jgi:hypothetical protein